MQQGIDTSKLALKSNLPSLKAKVDKIDFYKLKPVPYLFIILLRKKTLHL